MYSNHTVANAKPNCNLRIIKFCVILGINAHSERGERESERERERENTMVNLTTYRIRKKKTATAVL